MKPNSSSTTRSSFVIGFMNLERRSSFFAESRSLTSVATLKKRTRFPCLHAANASPVARCVLLHPLKCPPRNQTVCVLYHSGEKRPLPHEDALQGQDHCESSRRDSVGAVGYPVPRTVLGECVHTANCLLPPTRALNREWSSTHSPSPPSDADAAHLHSPDRLVTAVCEWWLPSPLLSVRYESPLW